MITIDNPQELLTFLGQHLKSKDLEKKQNGEVFTPLELIQLMLNKLGIANQLMYSDPSKKFLDPANGVGNYPAVVFLLLMDGLKDSIPNEADRKKHILENMLYMCEINKKNVEICRKLFDPKNEYKLNLYEGSYLDLDSKKEWGVEKFDVVLGNPPYQGFSTSGKANGGKGLWCKFVEKSIKLLIEKGYLVFVHPALWRKPGNELHDLMFCKQIHYLSIHNKKDGAAMFHAATRYDWYIMQNTQSFKKTTVRFDDGTVTDILITPQLPCIINHGVDIVEKLKESSVNGFLKAGMSFEGDARKEYMNKKITNKFPYPILNSSTETKGIILFGSSKPLKTQYQKKVLFSDGGDIHPFYDNGRIGETQHGLHIIVENEIEGRKIQRFLKSKLVTYIVGATKWSNYQTFPEVFDLIPHPNNLPDNFTDTQVYNYFGLTAEEICRIEADHASAGLADYVSLEAPNIEVPPPASVVAVITTSQPNYKLMNITDLKQLCKVKKIKGYSGKKKNELISILTS